MAFTYTDRNKKIVTQAIGKVKVTLLDAVAVGDLLNAGATSATLACKLADQSDSLAATLVALEDSVSGGTIEAAFAAELEAPTTESGGVATQTYFAATGDFLMSPVYLGESGKVSSSAGATMTQEVGKLLERHRIMLVPGASVFSSAVTATTITASGATALSSTLSVAAATTLATLTVTGTAIISGATTLKSTLSVSGATTLATTTDISGATTIHNNLVVTGTATVSGNATFAGTVGVSGVASLAAATNVSGILTFSDYIQHVSEASITVSAAKTLAVSDSGYLVKVNLSGIACTLPSVTGTKPGVCFRIVNDCTGDAIGDIRLNAGVTYDKFFGCGLSGGADLDLINTQSTAKIGDMVEVIGDGTTGWMLRHRWGTWNTT